MNKTLYVLAFLMISSMGHAQDPDILLKSIEANNPAIRASAKWLESEKYRSKTGIYPENPDITFNYMRGNPDAIGNQQELEITQKFSFPGYYFAISSMQKMEFSQSEVLA